jgi:mono/diheme cytochrome c family protein
LVKALTLLIGAALLVCLLQPVRAQQRATSEAAAAEPAKIIQTYCVTCHSDKARTGGLTLEHADLADIPKGAETWEKLIRKVRVGMMPPVGQPRPDNATARSVRFPSLRIRWIARLRAKPNPGHVVMHR